MHYAFAGDDASRPLAAAAFRHRGGRLRCAVAWATLAGAAKLREALDDHSVDVRVVLSGNSSLTEAEAILYLQEELHAEVWVTYRNEAELFHPKIYAFDGGTDDPDAFTAFVGSVNMTDPGYLVNTEAMIEVAVAGADRSAALGVISPFESFWDAVTSPENEYVHQVATDDDLKQLVEAGLVVTQRQSRRRRQRERTIQGPSARRREHGIPVAPTTPVDRPSVSRPDLPFPGPDEERDAEEEARRVEQALEVYDLMYVRTLTPNDVAKLRREQVGTLEPDLGEGPRDIHPEFWGWDAEATREDIERGNVGEYQLVQRKREQLEWTTTARLISSETPPGGALIGFRIWFRQARPDHAAEHRMRPLRGPNRKTIKDYAPPDFDEDALMVIERNEEEGIEFLIRLITPRDDRYEEYRRVARHDNPAHVYGYGSKLS